MFSISINFKLPSSQSIIFSLMMLLRLTESLPFDHFHIILDSEISSSCSNFRILCFCRRFNVCCLYLPIFFHIFFHIILRSQSLRSHKRTSSSTSSATSTSIAPSTTLATSNTTQSIDSAETKTNAEKKNWKRKTQTPGKLLKHKYHD
jgi:hypothetical protein